MHRICRRIPVNPQRIESRLTLGSTQATHNAIVEWAHHTNRGIVSERRQKFMAVPIQQGYVPLHAYSKPFVLVAADRKIGPEKYCQTDIRLLRDSSQQWRLILNWMAHQVRKSYLVFHSLIHSRGREAAGFGGLATWMLACCSYGIHHYRNAKIRTEAIPIRVDIPPDLMAALMALVGRKTISSACNTGSGSLPSNPGPPPSAATCISVSGEFCCSGIGPWLLKAPSR